MSDTSKKRFECLQIIKKLHEEMKDLGIGLPLGEVYHEIKKSGIYQENRHIGKCIESLERMGYITISNWNIVKVKT